MGVVRELLRPRLALFLAAGLLIGVVAIRVVHFGPGGTGRKVDLNFTLKDMNGHDVRLADFKGKPLLVNFWATWCFPCQMETPELVELANQYKGRGLTVIGISTDDVPADVQKFAAEYKVSYPLLIGLDRDDVTMAFGLGDAIPMSVLIRPDGTVSAETEGMNTKAWFDNHIQALF